MLALNSKLPSDLTGIQIYTNSVPSWIVPVSLSIVQGYLDSEQNQSADGEITSDQEGNIVLRRKLYKEDWDLLPALGGVNEVWITFHIPESS